MADANDGMNQMPADDAEEMIMVDGPMAPSTNGHVADHAAGAHHATSQLAEVRLPESFWRELHPRDPMAPHNYAPRVIGGFTPVIRDGQTQEAIDRLLSLADERAPLRAQQLRGELRSCIDATAALDTLLAEAEAELAAINERIEAENAKLEPELEQRRQELEAAEAELRKAHEEAADACGQIGAGYNPAAPSLETVLAAPVHLAAEATPPLMSARKSWIDLLAPFACGPVLGVALAHFTGFIAANSIANARLFWPQILVAALLGVAIYAGQGVGISWAAKQVHHQIDSWRRREEGHWQFAMWHVVVLLSFLAALLLVEVIVEGTAFRILFLEQIQRKVANGELSTDQIPHVAAGIFYFAGALLGMVFMLQKFGFSYHQAEVYLRDRINRIETAGRLQAWRTSSPVQSALGVVSRALERRQEVAQRQAAVAAVEARRQARQEGFDSRTEGRLEDARAEAVLAAARLRERLEALVEELEQHSVSLPETAEVWSRTPAPVARRRWPAAAIGLSALAVVGLLAYLLLL